MLDVESVKTRAPAIYKSLQYDSIKDFSPIAKIAKQRVLVVVNPSLPVNNVKELIAYARANPDKLNFGGTYAASSHIGGALFNLLNGTSMTMISYPGGAQPITDLIGGVVQVGFFTESTVAQHIKSGRLKALAVAANERSSQFPQLPTLKEAGAAPMDISPWFALTAPAGTPQQVVEKLHAATKRITEDKTFAERLTTIGAVPIHGSTPESYNKESIADIAYWKKFVVDTKFPMAE
jgi:tripartite-type tricarboxylate transporter receptor subunit TctC